FVELTAQIAMKKALFITLLLLVAITTIAHFVDKAHVPGWLAFGHPAAAKASEPGVDFSLQDIEGKNVSLSQFRGKVVFVDFWATDCGPCKVEIPWLIEMQQKYASRGFTVLGVAMDEEGRSIVAPFVATNRYEVNGQKVPMNYPILIGNDDVTS